MKHVIVSFALLTGACLAAAPENWWNPAWAQRQAITIEAGPNGAAIQENVSDVTVLVRLFDGNFNFMAATADGKDLRFVAADGKTVLPHTIERYDNLINEAFVWVKLPEVPAGESTTIHLYYGSAETAGATAPTDAFDDSTVMFHHFGKMGATFEDSTRNANHAENPGVTSDGGIIGPGLRVFDVPLVIPASETLDFTATQDGVIYTIEGSLDLATFESAVSEVTPTLGTGTPKAGYVFKTFRLNASAGLNGKGFIRAGAAVAP